MLCRCWSRPGQLVPLMAVIYSLPLALQFPLFALALAFWVLMMTYMTNRFAGKIRRRRGAANFGGG